MNDEKKLTPEELELAEIRARRAKLAAERAEKQAASAAAEKILEEKRFFALEEALVKAESEHGAVGKGVAVLNCRYADGSLLGSIIVKRPPGPYWAKFQQAFGTLKDAKLEEKIAELWHLCRVWPDVERVEALIKELPNTRVALVETIGRLAGQSDEEVQGKS